MRKDRGSSIVMWTVMFTLVFASLTLYRIHLKRAVQEKMYQTVDYLMWSNEAQDEDGKIIMVDGHPVVERAEPVEYKGNTNVGRKSVADFHSKVTRHENNKEPVVGEATSNQDEHAAHANVAEGADPVLRLFDMNEAVRH